MIMSLWNKARAFGRFLQNRTFALSVLSIIVAIVVFQITYRANVVYITNSDRTHSISFTMENNSDELLKSHGFSSPELLRFQGVSGHFTQMDFTGILKASVTVDGQTMQYTVRNGTTVSKLLHEMGIRYDGNDILTPAAEKPIEDGEQIVLKRVDYEQYTVDEVIPFETIRKNSALLRIGKNKCIQEGCDGKKVLTFVRRTVDGKKEDVQLLGENIVLPPVEKTILIGSLEPISQLDFDLNVDENGKPSEYTKVLTNQVATGYSARPGAKTASGRYAITGHVAVNPSEIPYGSKLYICSPDNQFVYGCAIAADTGTGLLADIIDVDLFYDTYQESVLNGRRVVDIYVLE